jgi:hypothetical protein
MTTDITRKAIAALLGLGRSIQRWGLDQNEICIAPMPQGTFVTEAAYDHALNTVEALRDALTSAEARIAEQRDEYEGYMAIIAAERGEVLALRKRVAELEEARRLDFNRGYLIACCNIANLHNEECIASDVLIEAGIVQSDVTAMDLNEYDAAALVRIRAARSDDPISALVKKP